MRAGQPVLGQCDLHEQRWLGDVRVQKGLHGRRLYVQGGGYSHSAVLKSTDRGVTWRRTLTSAKLANTTARLWAASAGTNRAATAACASTDSKATAGSAKTSTNAKRKASATKEQNASMNPEATDARKGLKNMGC